MSRSVADLVEMHDREEILALTPGERITLSLARRRPCRCIEELIG